MRMLSRPVDQIQAHYSAVVIGSGYGGAIAAARIARAGRDVCVLERGKELHPGEYPNSALSAAREIQVHTAKADHGSPVGLFDFQVGPDVTVLTGCGLGGTSLINASVALEPSDAIFADDRWPAPLRQHPEVLRPFMSAAREMLGSNPYPQSWPELPKLQALEQAAAGLGRQVVRPDLNVTFTSGPNAVGVRQNACNLCGDCCSGCNYGAKNTVLMNYLPDAYAHGAHIFTEVAVQSVRRCQGTWRVGFDVLGDGTRHRVPVRHGRRRRARGRDARVDADPAALPGPRTAGVGPARGRVLRQRRRAGVRLRHRRARARRRPRRPRPARGHGGRAHDHRPDRPARPGHGAGRRADHRGWRHPGRACLGDPARAERRLRRGARGGGEAVAGTRRDPVRLASRAGRPDPDLPGHEHRRLRRADRDGERQDPGGLARVRRAAGLRPRQPAAGRGHPGAARDGDPRPALGLDERSVADHRAPARRVRDGGRRGRRRGGPQGPGVRPGRRRRPRRAVRLRRLGRPVRA